MDFRYTPSDTSDFEAQLSSALDDCSEKSIQFQDLALLSAPKNRLPHITELLELHDIRSITFPNSPLQKSQTLALEIFLTHLPTSIETTLPKQCIASMESNHGLQKLFASKGVKTGCDDGEKAMQDAAVQTVPQSKARSVGTQTNNTPRRELARDIELAKFGRLLLFAHLAPNGKLSLPLQSLPSPMGR